MATWFFSGRYRIAVGPREKKLTRSGNIKKKSRVVFGGPTAAPCRPVQKWCDGAFLRSVPHRGWTAKKKFTLSGNIEKMSDGFSAVRRLRRQPWWTTLSQTSIFRLMQNQQR